MACLAHEHIVTLGGGGKPLEYKRGFQHYHQLLSSSWYFMMRLDHYHQDHVHHLHCLSLWSSLMLLEHFSCNHVHDQVQIILH